jgi:poly(A) polymerase
MNDQLKIDNQTLTLFTLLRKTAEKLGIRLYAVGGFVRDLILGKEGKDIDFVVIGDALHFVQAFHEKNRSSKPVLYPRFGTARCEYQGYTLEFVTAREEVYQPNSRKPTVQKADLYTDLSRRDFTINTLAIDLSSDKIGTVIDPYKGQEDLKAGILRTPSAPVQTFTDDPLRMMRAIRFAATLDLTIENKTYQGIKSTNQRLTIISQERITEEFNKIISAPKPSLGIILLEETGLLNIFLPEFSQTKGIEQKDAYHHKDVFNHTLQVVDQVAKQSGKLSLRLSALLHDIAKPATKRFDSQSGWTFHGHEIVGEHMAHHILNRMKYPIQTINYIKKMIRLHLRPMALVSDDVTDSAIRRLLFLAGNDFDDLMLLCQADITSKNPDRVKKYLNNYEIVMAKAVDLEERDRLRTFKSPVNGNEIMKLFNLKPGPQVGRIKKFIEEAILEGQVANDHDQALEYILQHKKSLIN